MTNQEELEFIKECSILAQCRAVDTKELFDDPRRLQLGTSGKEIVRNVLSMAETIRILREEANWGKR